MIRAYDPRMPRSALVAEPEVHEQPIAPPVAVPIPVPAPAGSRSVPGERGVPFDRTVLGSLAHPFGALEVLKPGITREEILSALPNAQRDGESAINVPVGVEDLMATIDIDFTGHLDVVRIAVPATAKDLLIKAWGKPTANGTWFDRKKRWRADLDEDNELMIGPFTPLADLLGKGPDGLAETKALIGATPGELTERFGNRIQEVEAGEGGLATKQFDLLLPATEHCKFFTHADVEVVNGRVAKLNLAQCYGDEASRRASLAAFESKWGRAIPSRTVDDRPVFTFAVPGRRVEMMVDEQHELHPGWQLAITAK